MSVKTIHLLKIELDEILKKHLAHKYKSTKFSLLIRCNQLKIKWMYTLPNINHS